MLERFIAMKTLRITFRNENRAAIFKPSNPVRVMALLASPSAGNRLTFDTVSGKQVMINLDHVLMAEVIDED